MKINTNNKLYLKILSTLVALVLWFAITYTEDPIISQNLGDISIVFEGEERLNDNGLIIVNKGKLPDLSAVIRGKRSSVISAIGTVVASCDVSGIDSVGENSVGVKYVYPTATITMAKMKTKEITVETEKIISLNVPVKITVKNADKNTEHMVKPEASADKIRVKGAQSDVYRISYAEVVVDAAQMSKNNTQTYMYRLCDKEGGTVSDENIISKSVDNIFIENAVFKKVSLPIEVKLAEEIEDEYQLTVKNLSADKVNVGIIGEILPEKLIAEISAVNETGEYELSLIVPEGVYVPENNKKVTATCEMIPLITEEKEVEIEVVNNQDEKMEISPKNIMVKVRYPKGIAIDGKVKASVDVKNVNAEETVAVKVEAPDKVEVIGEYSVDLYIK